MMPEESSPVEIPFQELLDALVDGDTVLHPKYLYQLSDLEADKLKKLKEIWSLIPVWQRQSLMENLEQLSESDYVLSFEVLSRFAIHDRDPKVRFYAIRSLIEYEAKDMLLEFKHLLEYDSETEVRCIAATALGSFVYLGELEEIPADKKREIEDCLLRVTQGGEEPLVRRRALEALGYSSREEVPQLIESAFLTDESKWLGSALFAMGRSWDQRWKPQVLEMLDNPFPRIRFEAARAAGKLEILDAVPFLLELLEDDDEEVRSASIWSLSQIGGEGVEEALNNLIKLTDDETDSALDNLVFTEGLPLHDLGNLTLGPNQ